MQTRPPPDEQGSLDWPFHLSYAHPGGTGASSPRPPAHGAGSSLRGVRPKLGWSDPGDSSPPGAELNRTSGMPGSSLTARAAPLADPSAGCLVN
jgi:hypothetical protein